MCLVIILGVSVYFLRSQKVELESSVEYYEDIVENPEYNETSLASLPDSSLPFISLPLLNASGEIAVGGVNRDTPNLYILFSRNDCYPCFKEIPFWHQLDVSFGQKVNVVGIMHGGTFESNKSFLTRMRIDIPVAFDSTEAVVSHLQLVDTGLTPVKVLVDPVNNVHHMARTTYDITLHQFRYARALEALLGRMTS